MWLRVCVLTNAPVVLLGAKETMEDDQGGMILMFFSLWVGM